MPLKLIPPGKRKRNPFYLLRGTHGGRRFEISTETTDRRGAEAFKRNFVDAIAQGRVPGPGEAVAFRRVAELYLAFRGLEPKHPDHRRLDRVNALPIGRKGVGEVVQADIVDAARTLHPAGAPGTLNREVVAPIAAVLHYAASNEWRGWLRIRRFKEPKAKTRAVTADVARVLINSVTEPKLKRRTGASAWHRRLMLLWLFRQGDRVSDPLKVLWPDLDLGRRTVRQHIGKTDEWVEQPLDDEVWEMLANAPAELAREGPLFPWRTKSGVYAWLCPMCVKLGVTFTPHMARHSLGKWLNDSGAGLRTIMGALRHADPKSSMRYQAGDMEVVRAATRKIARLTAD